MTDVHNKEQRSKNMSAIRGRNNKTTEIAMIKLLRSEKISGWRRHYKVSGTPDFVFLKKKIALFLDGCFWHCCPKCNLQPKSNTSFWVKKFEDNEKRDRRITNELRKTGWKVIRIWEHDIKNNKKKVVRRINSVLDIN